MIRMGVAFAAGLLSLLPRLSRKPLGPQALHVGIKRLLVRLMLAHGLLRVGATRLVAGLAFFGGENAGSACFVFVGHAKLTPKTAMSSMPWAGNPNDVVTRVTRSFPDRR